MTEPQWLPADPVAVAKAFYDGRLVELDGYGGDNRICGFTTLDNIRSRRYRIVTPEPKRYTLAEAQKAYCESRWIAVVALGFPSEWYHITEAPAKTAIASTCDWLIRDDDPREKPKPVPRQVDVQEAYAIWLTGGEVVDPAGRHYRRPHRFEAYASDVYQKWTVLEEPPCHA